MVFSICISCWVSTMYYDHTWTSSQILRTYIYIYIHIHNIHIQYVKYIQYIYWLVVWTLLKKYEFVPNWMESHNPFMFQTTNQFMLNTFYILVLLQNLKNYSCSPQENRHAPSRPRLSHQPSTPKSSSLPPSQRKGEIKNGDKEWEVSIIDSGYIYIYLFIIIYVYVYIYTYIVNCNA